MGEFTPAHYYEQREVPCRVVVLHTMEAPEGTNTAENVARYFASGSVVASAHACVDEDSVVVCLPPVRRRFRSPRLQFRWLSGRACRVRPAVPRGMG